MSNAGFSLLRPGMLAISALLAAIPVSVQAEVTAPQLLPDSTMAYVQIDNPARLIQTIEEHEVTRQLMQLDQYQQALESTAYKTMQLVLGVIEAELGKSWQEALADATGGGLTIAFDPVAESAVLLARSRDPQSLVRLRDSFLKLASAQSDETQQGEYRGVKAYAINRQAKFAIHGEWLVIVTEPLLGKAVLDRLLDAGKEIHKTLADTAAFQQALKTRNPSDSLWAYLAMDLIRQQGVVGGIAQASRKNMLVEILVGGIIPALEQAPFLTFSGRLDDEQLGLSLALPADAGTLREEREFFFGPGGNGVGPAVPSVEGTIFTLSTYRDLAQVWLRAPDLFTDEVNEGLAEADSTLTTLFAGREFGEDILGALEPQVQLIVVEQQFDPQRPVPQIKIPSFAVIAQMRDAERMTPELKRIFYSLVGFFNVVGAMEGQPQMDLELGETASGDLVSARFLPDPNQRPGQIKIQYNFSPTVAFRDKLFVLSSTRDLAEKILAAESTSAEPASNVAMRLHLPAVQSALEANRQQLVVQNMLSEGQTREEAEAQIGILLQLIGLAEHMKLDLTREKGLIRLGFEIGY